MTAAAERHKREIQALTADLSAAESSENLAKSVLMASPDPIVIYDMAGHVQYLNQSFTQTFGWTLEEVVGGKIDFVPEDSLADTIRHIKQLFKGKKPQFASKRLTKTGRIIPVHISAGSFQGPEGELVGTFVILRDMTEQEQNKKQIEALNTSLEHRAKELESLNTNLTRIAEKAKAMEEKAKAASIAKSEFLANMSHEIRTPMNGITGMVDLLIETTLTDEQLEFAISIQTSADALLSLLNDILDFSKIEAGKLTMEAIDFNLRTMVESFGDTIAIKALEKGVEFASYIKKEVPCHLIGDPGRLRQVLNNLAGNAVKFVESGEIAILVDLEQETDTHVMLRFRVTDTGIGIPKEKLNILFDSFTQVDASTTRKYGGTGLGLTISKQLVEMMDGRIGVESQEGAGSTFWFTARFKKQARQSDPEFILAKDLKGKRILIVDDVEINRRIFKAYLTSWGCITAEAANASDGYQCLVAAAQANAPFDMAILDMQMPSISGESIGKKIKATPETRHTHLVLATSIGQTGDAKRIQDIGFDAYLTKPVKQKTLFNCLRVISERKQRPAAKQNQPLVTRHALEEANIQDDFSGSAPRILLAEDNIINQKVAAVTLKKLGCNITIANNGREAVQKYKDKDFDFILMDGQMPIMDGLEATRQIRQLEAQTPRGRVPILAVTANAMKGDRERFLAAGMDDYISKPIKRKDLEQAVKKALGKGKG